MGYLFIAAGLLLFVIGVVSFFKTMIFSTVFYIFTFSGLIIFLLGVNSLKKTRQEQIQHHTTARVDRLAATRNVQMKKCPACGGEMEISLKSCPFCNYKYQLFYTLTVFTPFEVSKREGLIKYLMARTRREYGDIAIQLEHGMVFRYSTKEDADKNKTSFENLGCKVKTGENLID
jgi:hypothetical protein